MTDPAKFLDLLKTGLQLAQWELDNGCDNLGGKEFKRHQELWQSTVNEFKQAINEIEQADVPHVPNTGTFSYSTELLRERHE